MSVAEAVSGYYRLFGLRGVLLAARARLFRQQSEVAATVSCAKYPVYLRLRTSDISVFRQVLLMREYDAEFSKSPRVIIDAGANIGLTSVFYANKYPQATILAIEPESSNFEILKRNTEAYPNITAIHAALWKGSGQISVIDPGHGHYGFRTVDVTDGTREASDCNYVQSLTVDNLIADYNLKFIDILKIDIEASEKEVFDNSATWIDCVGVVVVELHDHLRVGCARSVYLSTRDFELEWRKGETVFLARKEFVVSNDVYTQIDLSNATAHGKNSVRSAAKIL